MPTMSRSAVKPARATPASCGWKARNMSSPTATSCISGSIPETLKLKASLRGAKRRSNPFFLRAARWIGSRSLSSGAQSRDPLARNVGRTLTHLPLVADRAEMLVDAEHDQDEFRGDARKHHADHDAGDRGQNLDESDERADRHCAKP